MESRLVHNQKKSPLMDFLYYIRNRKIDCVSYSSGHIVKLSFIDLIKRSIHFEASKFSLDESSLENLVKSLNGQMSVNNVLMTILENQIFELFKGNGSYFISFNLDGSLTNSIIHTSLITIDLRAILSSTFPGLPLSMEEFNFHPVKKDEKKVLELVREDKYHTVKFIKRKNKLYRAECEENLPVTKRVIDILKETAFQNIEIKQESGKAVYINRVVKTKLQ